ncbi:response regulator transcription factor [Rubrivirga sp. IMCC43871]|uniref:response regulator n=1 Tax=Rubrivirga sp. IMCC43871 TaxID=3391575 RepID=UPI0039900B1F
MTYRICLVEDHPVVRDAYTTVLADCDDLEVFGSVATAEEALALLDGEVCHLVVTDIRLPGMSGLDLVTRLATERPDVRTLVITGQEAAAFEPRAMAAGAIGFLPKRRAARQLIPTIRAALGVGTN